MRRRWRPGEYERGGNTKSHGLVRGEVTIRRDVPPGLRQGIRPNVPGRAFSYALEQSGRNGDVFEAGRS